MCPYMYECLNDLVIEVDGIRVSFKKGSLWDAKENEFGTIDVYDEFTNVRMNKKIFELYFKKVDE